MQVDVGQPLEEDQGTCGTLSIRANLACRMMFVRHHLTDSAFPSPGRPATVRSPAMSRYTMALAPPTSGMASATHSPSTAAKYRNAGRKPVDVGALWMTNTECSERSFQTLIRWVGRSGSSRTRAGFTCPVHFDPGSGAERRWAGCRHLSFGRVSLNVTCDYPRCANLTHCCVGYP